MDVDVQPSVAPLLPNLTDLERQAQARIIRSVTVSALLIAIPALYGVYRILTTPPVSYPLLLGALIFLVAVLATLATLRWRTGLASYMVLLTLVIGSIIPTYLLGPTIGGIPYYCLPLALAALLLPPYRFFWLGLGMVVFYAGHLLAFARGWLTALSPTVRVLPLGLTDVVFVSLALLLLWLVSWLFSGDLHNALQEVRGRGTALFQALHRLQAQYALEQQAGRGVTLLADELSGVAAAQASGSAEQAHALDDITLAVKDLTGMSDTVAGAAQQARAAGQATLDALHGSQAAVQETSSAIYGLDQAMRAIAARNEALVQQSAAIGTVAGAIEEIAVEVKVLALNATLEAAGVGVAGRRFGVVAGEVQALANRTAEATEQIQALVAEISRAQSDAARAIAEGLRQVREVDARATHIAGANRIVEAEMAQVTAFTQSIVQTSTEQQQIHRGIGLAMAQVAAVAGHVASSSQQIAQTTQELQKAVVQFVAPDDPLHPADPSLVGAGPHRVE